LQNFIPLAVTLPVARPFFERHGWYPSLRREISVAPDEIRWRGVRVYPYHFEAGDDLLLMVIDLQAEAPTAFETNDFYVACSLGRGGRLRPSEHSHLGDPQQTRGPAVAGGADGR